MKDFCIKLILCTVLCAFFPLNSFAYLFKDGSVCYSMNGTDMEVAPYSYNEAENAAFYKGSITIPYSVTYNGKSYKVTSIGNYAFRGCKNLKSISISSNVKTIKGDAFSGCTMLESVSIPSSLTAIGNRAFSGCTSLTSIKLPSSLTGIGFAAFEGCVKLKSITIPSVKYIESQTFLDCTALTTVDIQSSLDSIGSSAFKGCTNLKSIKIPNSTKTIGKSAFWKCM